MAWARLPLLLRLVLVLVMAWGIYPLSAPNVPSLEGFATSTGTGTGSGSGARAPPGGNYVDTAALDAMMARLIQGTTHPSAPA